MLQLSDIFINRKILSLRTGGAIGVAHEPVLNPDSLKLEGWYASENRNKEPMILPSLELRDIISKGLVVNDHSSLTEPEDLVRMQDAININFKLIGKNVVYENGKKIGKVQDYAVDDDSMYVQKLYINPSLLRGVSAARSQLIIDREQIVELTDKKIVVKSPTEKVKSKTRVTAPAG